MVAGGGEGKRQKRDNAITDPHCITFSEYMRDVTRTGGRKGQIFQITLLVFAFRMLKQCHIVTNDGIKGQPISNKQEQAKGV